MTCQDNTIRDDPLYPIRVGAHTYFVTTAYQDRHGRWNHEAPSSESEALRIYRLSTAPYAGRSVAPPQRQRKPSHNTIIKRAKKAGVTSVTVDGVTYTFGQAEQQTPNLWDEVLPNAPKRPS